MIRASSVSPYTSIHVTLLMQAYKIVELYKQSISKDFLMFGKSRNPGPRDYTNAIFILP